jgi:hypothetical protein
MNESQWKAFENFRNAFRNQCIAWSENTEWLTALEKRAAAKDHNPEYPLENPIVYNQSLDAVTPYDDIRLIVVGDNPGKDEQLTKNRRYLVGQAGKLGDGFFRRNPELGIDFRKNVIILNKTPIHTAKTKQLSFVKKNGGVQFEDLFKTTQQWMARETAEIQRKLGCELWLVGYGELRQTGLFSEYANALTSAYQGDIPPKVLVFQHFSMNRFSIDLSDHYDGRIPLRENLNAIGLAHRAEILGW